jgi:hypothetical protein
MDPTEIRRLFMKDHEWERTSTTWKALKPLRDFNAIQEGDESPQDHYLRLRPRFNIPFDVIDQWLYPHYYNVNSVNNYGWLNYDEVCFKETLMRASELTELNIIREYESYVKTREASAPFDDFMCKPQDKKHWQEKGTWRVPPIVIDVSTLHGIPAYAEVKGPSQLVEGHSRLGYLLAMRRVCILTSESEHRVYRMYVREGSS